MAAGLRRRFAFHLPGLGLLAVVAVCLMRRFVSPAGIPAGTDMFGFISRAAQYASFGRIFDSWAPSSFGYRHVFNFDNILGLVTLLTRNSMLTVKLLDVLTLIGAGLGAYVLAWSWYRRRLVATTAALLYMASQASLTRWGGGQLDTEIIISLAPVMLLTLSSCLERFTLQRSAGLTFTLGTGFLVAPYLVLWVIPFLGLYPVCALVSRRRFRAGLANLARTLAIAVPGVLLLNAAWLVPLMTGYRAQYETLNQIFSISSLSARSLTLYQSVLGFGRLIGYFAFTGAETSNSHPWLPPWGYFAFATFVPLLAYAALRWYRDRRTVFLVLSAVLATLAAPGTRPPLGGLYLWAAQNIPLFGNLRDPNNWLIFQAIAYALLASLTTGHIASAGATFWSRWSRRYPRRFSQAWAPAVRGAVALAVVGLAIVPVLPTFVTGLRTWHVTQRQHALLSRLRDAPLASRVASVPFGQAYRFLAQGSYRGYEHDLGYDSALFTERQDVGIGDWNQRSANFATYEATLLDSGDPAFARMLASAGVSRLVSFNYPLIAPQLLSGTIHHYSQQRIVSGLAGLKPIASNSAGTDFSVKDAAAQLSFRRDVAVVLGGSQGVAALADQPGVRISDWAVFTADDVVQTQGFPELLALIRKADLVLLADERPIDIAVEGTTPLTKLTGISGDPQVDRAITAVPTDQSAQAGSLNDVAIPIPPPQSASSSSVFSVRSPRSVAIWVRVLATPFAATIHVSLDGTQVGSITPVTLGRGFEWVRLATVKVGSGTHRLALSAVPSSFGDTYEIQEARVLAPGALRSTEAQLTRVLTVRRRRIAYDLDLADVSKWSWQSLAHRLRPTGRAFAPRGWAAPPGADASVTATAAPGGARAQRFIAQSGRAVYTFAKIRYKRPRNWAHRPYIYLEFKGSGLGELYTLAFNFGRRSGNQALYTFRDNSRRWETLAFSTDHPQLKSGSINWSKVRAVRVASSKQASRTLALGMPRPSGAVDRLGVPLPILPGNRAHIAAVRRSACVRGARLGGPRGRTSTSTWLELPVSSMSTSCRIYLDSAAGYRQHPAIPVRLLPTGTESWSYSFSADLPGALVWTQSYDPLWRLSGAGGHGAPVPDLSLLDGYLVGPGPHAGTIAYTGESSAIAGVSVTAGTSLFLLTGAVASRRRRRSGARGRRHVATSGRMERIDLSPPPPLRRAARLCLTVGAVFLVLCPYASLSRLDGALLPLSSGALLAFGLAAVLIAGSRTRPLPTRSELPKPREERVFDGIAR